MKRLKRKIVESKYYKSLFKEDTVTLDKFIDSTSIKFISNSDFQTLAERLQSLLTIFNVEELEVKKFIVLLAKAKEGNLTPEEENYFYKIIGNYFKESYNLKRYFSPFVLLEDDSTPETDRNLIAIPLIAVFMKNGFLVKLSQSNSSDFQKVLDEISMKRESIQNTLISSPSEGIKVINSALNDALKDSSYVNLSETPPEEAESIEETEWFKSYVTEDILNSIKSEVDKSNFEFELSYEEPVPETPEKEDGEEGAEGSGDELGGDELGGDELGGDELGGDELGDDELGGDEAPPEEAPAPEGGGDEESPSPI
jgi:hypothetical protein